MTTRRAISYGLLVLALGCSGAQGGSEPIAAATGGQPSAAGGTSAPTSTGGSASVGGSIANTGGVLVEPVGGRSIANTGGVTAATGGTGVGGNATGGVANATGGNSTGGKSNTGGAPTAIGGLAAGGTATGGAATGGTTATGGTKPTGGMSATGGAAATGGVSAIGGTSSLSICTGSPASGRVASIYVIGDSTASIYASDLYPRTGWGQVLGDYFATACAVVKDKALSGRSSKSFYDEGNWTPIRDALAAGDFVVIQFGHNDEKTDDATRYTDPQTTFKQYLTTYVNDTKAKKALPILATPINRNNWSGATLSDTHGAYPPAMRELATALSVPLVDMTALTRTHFERIGKAETTKLFMVLAAGEYANYPSGNTDNTHLQEKGARAVAQLFTSNAYQQKLPIAQNLKAIPVAP